MLNIKKFLKGMGESLKSLFCIKINKHNVKAFAVASVIVAALIFSSPDSKNSANLSAVAKAQLVSAISLEKGTEDAVIIQTDDKEELELDKGTEEYIAHYINVSEVEEQNALEEKNKALNEAAEIKAAEEAAKKVAEEQEAREAAAAKYSSNDLSILHRIVEAEATSEDIKGKILVANVVLNRVESSNFPNSVEGVVFQKRQFSPIADGRYYSVTVTESTKEAVNRAIQGEDYSNGALYFAARSMASSKNMRWFDSKLTYLFVHGCHEFFK